MISRYDGLHAFRLTELGAYCLGQTRSEPAIRAASAGTLVLEELEIHASGSGSILAADRLLLDDYSRPLREGVWALDRTRILETLSKGGTLTRLRKLLERHRGAKLPAAVNAFLDDCSGRAKSLERVGTARLLECRDRSVADAVTSDRRTAPHCIRASDTLLVVPLGSEKKFYRALRTIGFGAGVLRVSESEPG